MLISAKLTEAITRAWRSNSWVISENGTVFAIRPGGRQEAIAQFDPETESHIQTFHACFLWG